jgi:hypothetical protein
MNNETNRKLVETARQLRELSLRMVELLHELIRAVLIADMLGRKANEMPGKVSFRVVPDGSTFQPWRKATIHIRQDGVEVLVAPLLDAPMELWPEDLRVSYERHMRAEERRRVMRDA